ncbi:helix-turn-helix transcriptional regulator [Pseudomonas sp. H3(2019)]|uniref:helix-turn-helix transcriptional regulator n=1 Tax=Pseudomonas sp. H3(2019) TaxID=2598724 RepID=UPI0011958E45|nr:helix-turn-helix domain-containing protein [Pseudomonas sp. H3(2019)]TVT83212.1 helix-turn-helix domain-containing protein [Pseudomonas sp. H3(2019)]
MSNFFPLDCAESLIKIGLLAKRRRQERGLRQKDLAKLVGVAAGTLGKIEAGDPVVELRTFMLVLWHLGLLSEVFNDEPISKKAPELKSQRVRIKRVTEESF